MGFPVFQGSGTQQAETGGARVALCCVGPAGAVTDSGAEHRTLSSFDGLYIILRQ